MAAGFVYVMSNPAMPGLVKIGMTEKNPSERAEQLYSSGVPSPFTVEFAVWCADARQLEADMHDEFHRERANAGREFFSIDPAYAIERLVDNALAHAGVDARLVSEAAFDLLHDMGSMYGPHRGVPLEAAAIDLMMQICNSPPEWFAECAAATKNALKKRTVESYQREVSHFMEGIS